MACLGHMLIPDNTGLLRTGLLTVVAGQALPPRHLTVEAGAQRCMGAFRDGGR